MKLFKLILALFICTSVYAKEVKVKDVMDNEVTLNLPAKRIALGFYYTDFLAVGGKDAFKNVVGFSKAVWSDWAPISWNMYKAVLPELDKLADFGEVEAGSIAVEKILALNPDVLVLAKWQYNTMKDTLKPIYDAKIPVVVVDYHDGKLENHERSTKIFGLLTNNEARATQIMNEYKEILNKVTSRTKDIKEKADVYIEYGLNGPKDNGASYADFMWGALIKKAGANTIAEGLVKTWGPINPETVLVKNPKVIIIAGRESELKKNDYSMVMGNDISKEEANKRLLGFTKRPGWDNLDAVKNGNVFGGYHMILRTLTDIFMLEFIAKATYPELFTDLDPESDYINFHKKYLPVVPNGTFMMKLNK